MNTISDANSPALLHSGLPVKILEPDALAASSHSTRPRLDSLDWLRGLVMVLMVLDHTRDYLAAGSFNPRDVHETPLFLTRWLTHFCAPTFVFLAGVSAHLYGARGRSRGELSRFLFTRGCWLIFLELVVIRFGWTFSFRAEVLVLQVIWAIGISLLLLSGLIFLPRAVVALMAGVLILGHNSLDRFSSLQMGSWSWLWKLLHEQGMANQGTSVTVFIVYPLIPWIAVLASGYLFGPVMQAPAQLRRAWILATGLTLTSSFLALRAINEYGDPQPWSRQGTLIATVLSFVNCEKYPPSLDYLCMTLGPALVLLALAERFHGRLAAALVTFGRVPFFFYLLHIYLLHLAAVTWAQFHDGDARWLFHGLPPLSKPAAFGFGLPGVYVLWLGTIAVLYLPSCWFGRLKQRRRDWWLSYL